MRFLTLAFLAAAAVASAFTTADAFEATANYDPKVSMQALYYSKAAYCASGVIGNWTCPACRFNPGMQEVNVFTARDTQAYVGYDSHAGNVVVAVRGSANIQNWIDDFTFTLVAYPPCVGSCKVHKGFFDIYNSLAAQMIPAVKAVLARHPNSPLFVTGHSLGAAVSTLAALDLQTAIGGRTMYVYNFGGPRVGDPAFVQYATQHLPSKTLYRVTHKADPVPHLPPKSFGFLHVPHELFYDNDGNTTYTSCDDGATFEDKTCADHYAIPIGIMDHIKYLGISTTCSVTVGDVLMKGLPAYMADEFNAGYVEEVQYVREQ